MLCLYETSHLASLNLTCIISYPIVIPSVPSFFSNLQNLRDSRSLCTYCIIDSFGCCLFARNLVQINIFFGRAFFFIISAICEEIKSFNFHDRALFDCLTPCRRQKEVCNLGLPSFTFAALIS